RAWVVDGDTIRIDGIPIRLEGIDAPEKAQACTTAGGRPWPCGQVATRRLRDRIGARPVTCRPRALDRYRRVLARCRLPDETDLNAWLVREGWAVASGFSRVYAAEEAEAMAARRGIWAGPFMTPSEWRRQHGVGSRRHWSWPWW